MSENLIQHLDSNGFTEINSFNLPDLNAGATDTPKKFAFKNIATRSLSNMLAEIQNAIFGNDGDTELRIAADTNGTIGHPLSIAAAESGVSTGVWPGTGLKGIKITSLTASGESAPSDEVTFTIDDTTKKGLYSWALMPGATGYKIYRTNTPGTYGASSLIGTIGSGGILSFVDDGSTPSAGQPPTANTTGGSGPTYGTPPPDINFGTAALSVGNMAIGQQYFYWEKRIAPAGTPETGNPRVAYIAGRET